MISEALKINSTLSTLTLARTEYIYNNNICNSKEINRQPHWNRRSMYDKQCTEN